MRRCRRDFRTFRRNLHGRRSFLASVKGSGNLCVDMARVFQAAVSHETLTICQARDCGAVQKSRACLTSWGDTWCLCKAVHMRVGCWQVGFPSRDPEKLVRALAHTHRTLWIRSTRKSRVARFGQLLGFCRATSDGALSATIWDVAVRVPSPARPRPTQRSLPPACMPLQPHRPPAFPAASDGTPQRIPACMSSLPPAMLLRRSHPPAAWAHPLPFLLRCRSLQITLARMRCCACVRDSGRPHIGRILCDLPGSSRVG